ncbi:Uncharacterised protein [Vibrio cholerae]|nr:Uncharacterised protein [Vibrio cholerae]
MDKPLKVTTNTSSAKVAIEVCTAPSYSTLS